MRSSAECGGHLARIFLDTEKHYRAARHLKELWPASVNIGRLTSILAQFDYAAKDLF